MQNWFDKTDEEIMQRLKNVLRTENFQFIGKYEPVPQKDFGFFKDVRSLSGVKKFYPKDDGSTDERRIRPLEIYTKAYDKLVADKWYKFYAVPAAKPLRNNKRNPFLLQTDWKRVKNILLLRGNELIENIKNDALNTPEGIAGNLMRAIETISIDINTEPTTFIFELIQNADDYPNKENNVSITFQIDNSHLIIKHNGSNFEVNNAVALCGVNEGDKREDTNKIGFKGIGFKSIFKDANFAYIKSGDFSFRFDEEVWRQQGIEIFWHITPIHTPVNEFRQVLKTESNVNIVIRPREIQALNSYRQTFLTHFNDERILLFLRNVKSLTFDSTEEKFEISNSSLKWKILTESKVEVPKNETNELNRRINFPDKRIPVKYYDITLTELGFGFRINQNKVESIDDGFIYAYLPTKVNLGFSFILNGNFIPDASRTKIYSDLTWNSFLFERAGELFIKQIISLLNEGLDKETVLDQIPSFPKILLNIRDDDKIIFINCFKKGFETEILNQRFIPIQSGALETLSNILIDETGLADILKEDFPRLTGITGKLIHSEVGEGKEKIKALITEYEQGATYKIENLKVDLKKIEFQEWLKAASNNFKLIQYFSSKKELKGLLDSEEIVLIESGELSKAEEIYTSIPNEVAFFPNKKLNTKLKELFEKSNIELKTKNFNATYFLTSNKEIVNLLLTTEEKIINFWNFIYDNWKDFKENDEVKKSIRSFSTLCKPIKPNELNIKQVSATYLCKEMAVEDEVETIIESLKLKDKFFVNPVFINKESRNQLTTWIEIFSGGKRGLLDLISELIHQLTDIDDSLHFKAGNEIFKYWNRNKEKPEKQLTTVQVATLKQSLRIKCTDTEYRKTSECLISDHYNNNQLIASWLPIVELPNQVAQEYAPRTNQVAEWKNFLLIIGCVELQDKQNVLDAKLDFIVASQDILKEKHFGILKSISDLHKAKNENGLIFDFENTLSQIKLQTSNDEWHLPHNIHLSNSYKPKLSLQNDEAISSTLFFLSNGYAPAEIEKYFVTAIGVNDGFFFKKIIPKIHIDKVQERKYVSQLESIEKYCIRVQEIRRMTSKDYRGNSVRSYPDEKIRLNTYVFNHLLINYPQLLSIPKYSELFLKFVIKNKYIQALSTETEIRIWNNNVYKHQNYIVWLVQTHSLLINQEDEFVNTIKLFSFKLSNYISCKAVLPKNNYTTEIAENGKSLEEILGIQQMLTVSHCIELLCRVERRISYEELTQLQIVNILSGYTPTEDEKAKLYLLNKDLEWKPINKLFISSNEQFQVEPTQHLHEDFNSIAGNFGIQELSEDNLVLKTKPQTPTVSDEIITFFRGKAKFIAFKIDYSNYEEIESEIIEKIIQFKFYEVTSIAKVFPEESSIYKSEIDFHLNEGENNFFYKGNWKTNKPIIDFLFQVIQHEKIERLWFDNIINRWDDDKIIEKLNEEVGATPSEWNSNPQSENENKSSKQENTESFWTELTIDDEKFIRGIIKGEYELNEQLDANTAAKIKTLMKIRNEYTLSEISDEGRFLKAGVNEILVRSAQNGILYLDLYHWARLSDNNVQLAIYTNSQIAIYDSQASLIQFTKPQNKFGILRMPIEYGLDDYNSLENITDKGKWHFVFIVNEKTKAAQNYKEVMNLDDYNF